MDASVPAAEVPVHEHAEAHLVLVLRGTYSSAAVDMPSECADPALVLNPPGTIHRDRFVSSGGSFLSTSLPSSVWQHYAPARSTERRSRRLGIDALAIALRIAASLRAQDSAARLDLEAHVDALLQLAAQRTIRTPKRSPSWLARARDRLAAGDAECSLGDIARDCGVQPAQLSRAFRHFEGCTPGQFLRRQRLQRVIAQCSREEFSSLTDAAHAAGFFDHAHMIRAMRQEAGVTPSQLRAMLQSARSAAN